MSEDNSWVFDSLVCFLHGPIWNAPLQTFIEEKSLIFDPNESSDENDPEYGKIHDEYKNLVDYMLGSFMDEMKITPEQFEVACLEGRQNGPGNSFSFHQGLFQQIWAANDIRIFIRMMIQRNVELQLQALDLIETRHNSYASSQSQDDGNAAKGTSFDRGDLTQEELEQIGTVDKVEQQLYEAVEKVLTSENAAVATTSDASLDSISTAAIDDTNDKFQRLNLFFEKDKISSADVKSRQEYLRAQRDKILKLKKKARAYQLNESVKKNGRPSSAQAAQNILATGTIGGTDDGAAEPVNTEASLQLRKTLAKRLRTEVVGKE